MRLAYFAVLANALLAGCAHAQTISPTSRAQSRPDSAPKSRLSFRVTLPVSAEKAADSKAEAESGRLFVVLGRSAGMEPRRQMARTGLDSPPAFAHDEPAWKPGETRTLDGGAIAFPLASMAALPAGDYYAQSVFLTNRDLYLPDAPGNRYSRVQKIHLDPNQAQTVSLPLTERIPDETLPPDTDTIRYVKLPSKLLSAFWHRPMFLRAAVLLPRDYEKESTRQYPLRVHIGGYGSRFTGLAGRMNPNSDFRKLWLADSTPRFLMLMLDGAGPLGDPYQVNSANHGPYGDAVTQELIPYVEKTFRGIGQPYARVLDGGSTGGWVSFALQVFYPDFFNGTWSAAPDPVDFRAYQLVNIYSDSNAYVNQHDFERPAMRERNGETVYTMRHEVGSENLLGMGDSYAQSGGQWGAWNATYSPRGSDNLPIPLWNPQTGIINHTVAEQWKKYDLRAYLEANWATLGLKLRGKIHITVGDADNYFLNNAVHLLDAFLSKAEPKYEGSILYGPGEGHVWTNLTEAQLLTEMNARVQASAPSLPAAP